MPITFTKDRKSSSFWYICSNQVSKLEFKQWLPLPVKIIGTGRRCQNSQTDGRANNFQVFHWHLIAFLLLKGRAICRVCFSFCNLVRPLEILWTMNLRQPNQALMLNKAGLESEVGKSQRALSVSIMNFRSQG